MKEFYRDPTRIWRISVKTCLELVARTGAFTAGGRTLWNGILLDGTALSSGRQDIRGTTEEQVRGVDRGWWRAGRKHARKMIVEERRSRLLELVRLRGFASLPDLAHEMGFSESTVRRDLDYLEETGEARRTHGGVLYTGPSPKIPHFDERQAMNWDKKRLIARAAAQLIEDGDTVLLDGGSTTYELARELVGRTLQVVTNSLPVASLFTAADRADLVFVGGYVHARTGVTLGPYANQMLGDLNVRRAVLSVSGATDRGFFNSNLLLVETERAMMNVADEVIVVADSTKFGRSSLALLCALDRVQTLVVDHELSCEWQDRLQKAGVRLEIAAPPVTSDG